MIALRLQRYREGIRRSLFLFPPFPAPYPHIQNALAERAGEVGRDAAKRAWALARIIARAAILAAEKDAPPAPPPPPPPSPAAAPAPAAPQPLPPEPLPAAVAELAAEQLALALAAAKGARGTHGIVCTVVGALLAPQPRFAAGSSWRAPLRARVLGGAIAPWILARRPRASGGGGGRAGQPKKPL